MANASTVQIDAGDVRLDMVALVDELQKMHFTELHDAASGAVQVRSNLSAQEAGCKVRARLRRSSGAYRRVMIHNRAVICDDAVYAVSVMTDLEE